MTSSREPAGAFEQAVRRRLDRIADLDRDVRSLVLVDEAGALAQARRLDELAGTGARTGPLAGLLVAVKDNIDVTGQVTACGSLAHDDRPAATDAVIVGRLRAAGAVVVGRANMDELAMGASTATSARGATRNPWDRRRSPGGSSGGCAAAVALGLVDLAIGTDTGGSVREPAAQCGVLGLAPTPGLLPTHGVVPFAPSCDRVGPIAATADLLAAAMRVMSDPTPDRTAPDHPSPDHTPPVHSLAGLRVGLVRELSGEVNQPGVLAGLAAVVARLTAAGAVVEEVSVPDAPAALEAYLDLTSAEAARTLDGWLTTGRAGPEVVRRLALGRDLLRTDPGLLTGAALVRSRLRRQVHHALEGHDVLLSPTLPTTAPLFAPAGPSTADVADPMTAPYTDCWTVVANLTGVPALSIPAGHSPADGMPVGAMFLARPGDDALLLHLAGSSTLAGLGDRPPATVAR